MPSLVDDHPNGWPRLAAFQNSADSFLIFRRFSLMHCRLLVGLQVEITDLEKRILELDRIDAEVGSATGYRLRTIEHHNGWDPEKISLSEQLMAKLQVYGKYSS
jgi:hypothetical protein